MDRINKSPATIEIIAATTNEPNKRLKSYYMRGLPKKEDLRMKFSRPRSLGIWITDQDQILFRYLYENKVALAQQIQRDIYPQYTLRSVNNRLGKMIKRNLVRARQYRELGWRGVYSLDARGFTLYIKPLAHNSLRQELESGVVRHDLDLLEIRKRLEATGEVKRYFTENMIVANKLYDEDQFFWFSFIGPDAIVEIGIKGKTFRLALEYESARKYVNRYETLLRNYYHFKIAGILYICKNDALLKRIRSIEKRTIEHDDRKFYYSDFSKWKQGQPMTFTNLLGASIILKPMTCAYDSVVSPHHLPFSGALQNTLKSKELIKPETAESVAD